MYHLELSGANLSEHQCDAAAVHGHFHFFICHNFST